MKKHNRVTRMMSILLAVLLIVALPLSVSAQEVDSAVEMTFPIMEGGRCQSILTFSRMALPENTQRI